MSISLSIFVLVVALQTPLATSHIQFTNPTQLNNCEICCEDAFRGEDDQTQMCQQIGCGSFESCFDQGGLSDQCQNGRDFRLLGTTRINNTDFSCDNGLNASQIVFSDVENEFFVDEEACISCCTDFYSDFNLNDGDVFSLQFCTTTCSTGGRDCLGEGTSQNRLGCAMASDFLVSGTALFNVNPAKQFLDENLNITCLASGIVQVSGDLNIDRGSDDEHEVPFLFYMGGGVILLVAVLIASAAVLRKSNSSSRERRNEGSFGQVNLRFGNSPTTFDSPRFQIRTAPVTPLEKKTGLALMKNPGYSEFDKTVSMMRASTENTEERSSKFSLFRDKSEKKKDPKKESDFNIQLDDEDITLTPVSRRLPRAGKDLVSGLEPPKHKIWSFGGRTVSLFSTQSKRTTDVSSNVGHGNRSLFTSRGVNGRFRFPLASTNDSHFPENLVRRSPQIKELEEEVDRQF